MAFVDLRDVAEVAGLSLSGSALLVGRAVTLTGPRSLDFDEVAALITTAVGRTIRYERPPKIDFTVRTVQ